MNSKILTLSLAFAALVFTGCNKNENEADLLQKGELRLTSDVNLSRTFNADNQIYAGQNVAVYVDKVAQSGTTQIYGNNLFTANGTGGFTGGTTMYFPEGKENVDIYAFVIGNTLQESFPASAVTHAVKASQKVTSDYVASDLLYSAHKGVAFTKQAVNLPFYHMLSKLNVAITPGVGSPNLTGAKVFFLGLKLKADFTPNKGAIITEQSARAAMIGLTAADNDAADIEVNNLVSANLSTPEYNEAVIVPQTVAQDAQFIKIELASGGVLYHKLASATTFESGKSYTYQITVNYTELDVTSSVEPWSDGGTTTGGAEM